MTIVVDASVVIAALIDPSTTGNWAESLIMKHELLAPHLLVIESLNVLCKLELSRVIEPIVATQSARALDLLPIRFVNEGVLSDQIWELRHNITSYDATYLTLARSFDIPLATLDAKLTTQDVGVSYFTP